MTLKGKLGPASAGVGNKRFFFQLSVKMKIQGGSRSAHVTCVGTHPPCDTATLNPPNQLSLPARSSPRKQVVACGPSAQAQLRGGSHPRPPGTCPTAAVSWKPSQPSGASPTGPCGAPVCPPGTSSLISSPRVCGLSLHPKAVVPNKGEVLPPTLLHVTS